MGLLALAAAVVPALAAAASGEALEQQCWMEFTDKRTHPNTKEITSVDFSTLANDFTVTSPVQVDFAVRGMGVAPAGKNAPRTGHHHILIDTPLPMDPTLSLPFNERYRHFGKGQTSTQLDLPPGTHTLRLLFADAGHHPYFVYSPEITIHVLGPRASVPPPRIDPAHFAQSCAAWYQQEVARPRPADRPLYLSNLRDEETVSSPFNVRLGVVGFGIAPAGIKADKTGYFMLDLLKLPGRELVQEFDLSKGTTQANVFASPGSYVLRQRFMDPLTNEPLLSSNEVRIVVK